jgi:hypothetical protein
MGLFVPGERCESERRELAFGDSRGHEFNLKESQA